MCTICILAVTGITKSTQRHESLLQQMATERFQVGTLDSLHENNQRYHHVVFCAPPSGFEDYPKAVEEAITNIWAGPKEGGVFVFTSSGGMYVSVSSIICESYTCLSHTSPPPLLLPCLVFFSRLE